MNGRTVRTLIAFAVFAALLVGGGALLSTQLPAPAPEPSASPGAAAASRTPEPSAPAPAIQPLAGPAVCENGTFRVYVPAGWHTLQGAGGTEPVASPGPTADPFGGPECRFFAPEEIDESDVTRFSERPGPGVSLGVIALDEDTGIGQFETPTDTSEVTLSGLPGDRLEFGATGGAEQDGRSALQYVIDLEGEAPPDVPSAAVLTAWYSAAPEDYETHLPAYLGLLASFEMLDGSTEAAVGEAVDGLFSKLDTCERPDVGLVFTIPDDWYANTEFEEIEACTYFAPRFYEITDLDAVPEGVEVVVRMAEGPVAPPGDVVLWDQQLVGDWPAARYEVVSRGDGAPAGERTYRYAIGINGELPSEAATQPYLVLETSTAFEGDYPLARAVIDEIVERVEEDR